MKLSKLLPWRRKRHHKVAPVRGFLSAEERRALSEKEKKK